jgi:hypothetical protein
MKSMSRVIGIEDWDDAAFTPYLHEVAGPERARFGSDEVSPPDSKQWECAMALCSFDQHGLLREGNRFLGVGAGTEITTALLADRGCIAFPSDRYLETTAWSDVAPPGFVVDPASYFPSCRHPENIIPIHGDARSLRAPSGFFHGVYSSGSIEHFGSLDAVEAAAAEIGRVLIEGGIASVSTEFRLDGPNDQRWFDDNCILFTPELLDRHIVQPSGLELVGSLLTTVSPSTYQTRRVLLEFLEANKTITSYSEKRTVYPNLVLYHSGFLFCSVHLLMRKGSDWQRPRPRSFVEEVARETTATAESLLQPAPAVEREFAPFSDASGDYARALQEVYSSTSWRITKPMRTVGDRLKQKGRRGTPSYGTFDFTNGLRLAAGRTAGAAAESSDGVLSSFGPYIDLPPGRYRLSVHASVAPLGTAASIAVSRDSGTSLIAQRTVRVIPGRRLVVDFQLTERSAGVEFKFSVAGVRHARLSRMLLTRRS